MKKIAAILLIVIFVFITTSVNSHAEPEEEDGLPVSDPGIIVSEKDGVAVFTISGISHEEKAASIAPYLTQYYFEKGGYREVFISCFLSIETAFPSDEYDVASRQINEICNAFINKGVEEAYLFISVRFEKNIPPGGMISVEFLEFDNYFQRAGSNFVTGITDIVSSPLELPMGMVSETKKNGPVSGVPMGVFSGFGQALRKAGNGTIKLLTFWAG
jgi:putative exosortase-associated protein (TIGR04073 family)